MSLEKNLEANTQALLRSIAVMEKLLALLAEGLPTPTPPTPPAPAGVMPLKSHKTNNKTNNKVNNKKLKTLDASPKPTTPKNTTSYSLSDARAALLHIAKADGQETAKAVLERIAGVSVLPKAGAVHFADLVEHAVNEYQYELSA